MLLPMGPMGGGLPDDPVPEVVKDSHSRWWRCYMWMLLTLCVMRLFALDVIGALVTGIMAYLVHFITRDNCERMTQCIVLMYGFMCMLNLLLETVVLFQQVSGRREQHMSAKQIDSKSTTYTITEDKHAFFDQTMGPLYNMQSACMVLSPLCQLIGASLCYYTYHAYPRSVFEEPDDGFGRQGLGGRGGGGNGGNYGAGGYGNYGGGGGGGGGFGGGGGGPRPFQGGGQRLGGS
eukprot:TRINITY_DN6784_c2_g1_i1.p1 TRINITY_DN6784_c2_g1~~TRINITY_DN6784_c2_g1_i1.p1  ORF type:complete len:234 (+),score=51.28 TRINITY_DN6784_c2_g1_i1:110-811(+)